MDPAVTARFRRDVEALVRSVEELHRRYPKMDPVQRKILGAARQGKTAIMADVKTEGVDATLHALGEAGFTYSTEARNPDGTTSVVIKWAGSSRFSRRSNAAAHRGAGGGAGGGGEAGGRRAKAGSARAARAAAAHQDTDGDGDTDEDGDGDTGADAE